jgi:hypothetical protein
MARVNTNTPEGIAAASNKAPVAAPPVDTRAALAKLQSGQSLTDNEKRALGLPVAETPADATVEPDPVEPDKAKGKLPAGFTAGAFPKELEQFFGPASGFLGYKIETRTDKNGKTFSQLSVATGPNSTQTFGAGFTQGPDGTYSSYSPSGGSGGGGGNDNVDGPDQGKTYTAPDGRMFTSLEAYNTYLTQTKAEEKRRAGQSAYDILYAEFDKYGLGTLVSDIKNILVDGSLDPTEFSLKIRNTDAYKARFIANEARLAKGLRALSPASYIALEDQYQDVMRRYGLPDTYYSKSPTGIQEGFNKLIENRKMFYLLTVFQFLRNLRLYMNIRL